MLNKREQIIFFACIMLVMLTIGILVGCKWVTFDPSENYEIRSGVIVDYDYEPERSERKIIMVGKTFVPSTRTIPEKYYTYIQIYDMTVSVEDKELYQYAINHLNTSIDCRVRIDASTNGVEEIRFIEVDSY